MLQETLHFHFQLLKKLEKELWQFIDLSPVNPLISAVKYKCRALCSELVDCVKIANIVLLPLYNM